MRPKKGETTGGTEGGGGEELGQGQAVTVILGLGCGRVPPDRCLSQSDTRRQNRRQLEILNLNCGRYLDAE